MEVIGKIVGVAFLFFVVFLGIDAVSDNVNVFWGPREGVELPNPDLDLDPRDEGDADPTETPRTSGQTGGQPSGGGEPIGPTAGVASAIPAGQTVESGTLVVVRKVDHNAMAIDVSNTALSSATTFGPNGMTALDGWMGYSTERGAWLAACREALARNTGAHTQGSWEAGYTITLNGGPVPASCS